MPITNSKSLPYQMDRTIVDMFYDTYIQAKPLWRSVFKKEKAPPGSYYKRADLAGLGPSLREAGEGEPVEYVSPIEGNVITRYYKKFHLGFQVTEEMLEDELHDKIKLMPQSLAKAADITTEIRVWSLLNNAFGTSYSTAKDGKAIIANNHSTLRGTTISNLITGDLDTTTLQQAFEYFQSLYSEDDIPITEFLSLLIVSPSDMWKAQELLKSTGRVWDDGSLVTGAYSPVANRSKPAANAGLNNQATAGYPSYQSINLLNPANGAVNAWNYLAVRYLTDADAWFALSKNFDGKVLMKREPKLQSGDDVSTGSAIYRVSTRFVPFIDDYRYICGSAGA